MMKNSYLGWTIFFDPTKPVTGNYRARKWGVGLCAGSYEALIRMIRNKEED